MPRLPDPILAKQVAPEHHLGHGFRPGWVGSGYADAALGLPRVSAHADATVYATLTLPYAYPSSGSLHGHDFASIHSSPPWTELDDAAVTAHAFGAGRSIYSVAPLERGGSQAETRAFIALIEHLLGDDRRLRATGHPDIWLTMFAQPDRRRLVVNALAYRTEEPAMALPLTFEVRTPAGTRAIAVTRLSDDTAMQWRESDGWVQVDAGDLDVFEMFAVEYATGG